MLNLNHGEFASLSFELLERGAAVRFAAHGSSMWPFIRGGDVLVVRPVEVEALRVGDVVLYRTGGGGLMAHRMIRRAVRGGQTGLLIRGDGSAGPGDWVRPEQVLGRVTTVERGERMRRLDRYPPRLLTLLWIGLWPLSLRCCRLMSALKRAVLPLSRRLPD
jgi:signal peptidase